MSRFAIPRRRGRWIALVFLVALTAAAGVPPRVPLMQAPLGPALPSTDQRPGGGTTIFAEGAAPLRMDAGDTRRRELGVRFTADAPGEISGISFYQGRPDATGQRETRLWTDDGTLLATAATITDEGTGWRYAAFGAPVPIEAGRRYVASYSAADGRYPVTGGGLATGYTDPTNRDAPLHVVEGVNAGLASATPGAFPTPNGTADNYWVDVVYRRTGPVTVTRPCRPGVTGSGPVLVVTGASNHYTDYLAEILRAEGLPAFATADDCNLDGTAALDDYGAVVLGDGVRLTRDQVTRLGSWVARGGTLVAMRPAAALDHLLGLTSEPGTLADGYLKIDTSLSPGDGLVPDPLQWHGVADLHRAAPGTRVAAALYRDARTPTGAAAVSVRRVGRGTAVAFAYDLARSVVFTRQGNPAWEGQNRDGSPLSVGARSDDQFYGHASYDPHEDYVDFDKIQLPQADLQQRLLVNALGLGPAPLPRLGYLPRGLPAAVVMTGDGHPGDHTGAEFDEYLRADPPGCSVAAWTCYRYTAYDYPDNSVLTWAEADRYVKAGFELSLHVTTDESDYSPLTLDRDFFDPQLARFKAEFPGVPSPRTERLHAVAWSDWDAVPRAELAHGIRLDTTYYYWPDYWARNRPGLFTGSGLPMRYAALDGTPIDVHQAVTQIPDESGLDFRYHFDTLLDNARKRGFTTVVTANCHLDGLAVSRDCATAGLRSARARGLPVISAAQLLEWLDAREATGIRTYSWTERGELTFRLSDPARDLQLLFPARTAGRRFTRVLVDGTEVPAHPVRQGGADYLAVEDAPAGSYLVTYDWDLRSDNR